MGFFNWQDKPLGTQKKSYTSACKVIPQDLDKMKKSIENYEETKFVQYMARIWPRYSLRGLHFRITWFS